MVKLNSTTAILSDLDGVILDIDYDIKFWESWLPEHIASQSSKSIEEAKSEILTKIDIQKGIKDTVEWYITKGYKGYERYNAFKEKI